MRDFYKEFGRLVRAARNRVPGRLTQAELGSRVGLKRSSISNIEQGRQHVPIHMLYRFAAELGVKPGQLLPPFEETRRDEAVRVMQEKGVPARIINQVAPFLEQVEDNNDDERREGRDRSAEPSGR